MMGKSGLLMEFTASIGQLHHILQWIGEQLVSMDFKPAQLHRVELASEEALVNILNHAYQGRPEMVEILVRCYPKSHAEITFKDHGPRFNPLEAKPIDPNQPLEKRENGGLGIHFIRKSVDEVLYERIDEKNVLVLVIRSSQKG